MSAMWKSCEDLSTAFITPSFQLEKSNVSAVAVDVPSLAKIMFSSQRSSELTSVAASLQPCQQQPKTWIK
jgi:hypothetical protein